MKLKVDFIPVNIGKKIVSKKDYFYAEGITPKGATNLNDFIAPIVEKALKNDYLQGHDYIIVLVNGNVYKIIEGEEINGKK